MSSIDSGSIQLAMSESMSDESMIGSGGETLDGRKRPDARDLIATSHDLLQSLPGTVREPASRRTVFWPRPLHVTATNKHMSDILLRLARLDWNEQGLTSHSTHFRSFRRRWGDCGISQDCSHSQSPQCVRC